METINWKDRALTQKFGQFLLSWIQNQVEVGILNPLSTEAVRTQLKAASKIWHESRQHLPVAEQEQAAIEKMVLQIVNTASKTAYTIPPAYNGPGRVKVLQSQLSELASRVHGKYGLTMWDYVIGGLYAYDIGTNFLGMALMFEFGAGERVNPLLKIIAYIVMALLAFLVSLVEHAIARGFNTFVWLLTRKNENNEFYMEPGTRLMSMGATGVMTLVGIAIMFWGYSTSASVIPQFMGESDTTRLMGWLVAFFISSSQWVHIVVRRYYGANLIRA